MSHKYISKFSYATLDMGTFTALQMRLLGNLGAMIHVFKGAMEYGAYESGPHAAKGFRCKVLPIPMPGLELPILIDVISETRH